jgi:diguanylate cyclase (GGDEF)-like protein
LSFKYRLRTFFFLLTVLPLLAAGYAVQDIFRADRSKRVDASLVTAIRSSTGFYEDQRSQAIETADALANQTAVQFGLAQPAQRGQLAQAVAAATRNGLQVAFQTPNGQTVAGSAPSASAPGFVARRDIVSGTKSVGSVIVGFPLDAATAGRLSTSEVAIAFVSGDKAITKSGTKAAQIALAPGPGTFDGTVDGTRFRVLARDLGNAEPSTAVAALYPRNRLDSSMDAVRRNVAIVVLIALAIVLVLAEVVLRGITGQLGLFARRAREVGEGNFGGEIPVEGNDEFAQFAGSFNKMSNELELRIDELEGERTRVRDALARFGQALESTHDVAALLQIVIESAMEGIRARGGRVMIVDEQTGGLVEHRRLGTASEAGPGLLPVRVAYGEGVEGRALQSMGPEITSEPAPALSVPLQSTQAVIGLLTLIDPVRGSFYDEDAETVQALAAQGAIAIENARMHRLITKQASTDGLTGLANHREFQDELRHEVERAQRFALPLALVLFDIDDFKLVNDRFGHLAGDSVLRSVASHLRQSIREIDCAARYGGEEFAVILPGTTADGAARLAERIRVAIAERPVVVGDERNVGVTASFGISGLPGNGATQVELVAAADRALYRAKEAGKNRVEVAGEQVAAAD